MNALANPLTRGPIEGVRLRVLSLGAGVQSSTIALLAARGEIGPMPDAAIFADTGSEPRAVYGWLDWLEAQLPFPVHRVSKGNLGEDLINASDPENRPGISFMTRVAAPPLYTAGGGIEGMIARQCTKEYKLGPIRSKIRELIGIPKGGRGGTVPAVEQWIGISFDELQRVKESREPYIAHRWPLVERRWTRRDCLAWWEGQGLPKPPRSACTFCPYHSDEEWRAVQAVPEDWADALRVDDAVRKGLRNLRADAFVHRSCVRATARC